MPEHLATPGCDWRLGKWTREADAILAQAVRVHRFKFEAAAAEVRSALRDATLRRAGAGGDLGGWSPKATVVTAEQVRLRWAILDREMCRGRTA